MNDKHFELTDENINWSGKTLYRIRATRYFYNQEKLITRGTLGGFVEHLDNLKDKAWIFNNAIVFGHTVVSGNAQVSGDAKVSDNAQVSGDAKVSDNAKVFGNAIVYGNAQVSGYSSIYGNAQVSDNAEVYGNAIVSDNAKVFGHAVVSEDAEVWDNTKISDNAQVYGNAKVYGNANICRDAVVNNEFDYIIFKNNWSSGRHFTWTKSNNMWSVGCFCGTGEELVRKAYSDSEESGRKYEGYVQLVEELESL